MSRSTKKTPIAGITTAKTEKQEKRWANRKERRKVKAIIVSPVAPDLLPHRRELSNVWVMSKDGKWRFDPVRHPKLLRK